MTEDEIGKLMRVSPGARVHIADYNPGWAQTKELEKLGKLKAKERAAAILERSRAELAAGQELLYAADTHAVLIILQAMDAAGKDSTIKHVMSGVNPQGCQVHSFKTPSQDELQHDFLWRSTKVLPERGRIGIFNRSYYEEVLIVKVHPELLARQKLPDRPRGKSLWEKRYEDINAFERHLVRNGTVILKFFLNISKEEQKRRFLERLDNPAKRWKFEPADIAERGRWDDYMRAYEDALSATSTKWAPWYVIPADQKWVTRTAVADIVAGAIRSLDLDYPELSSEQLDDLAKARKQLEQEST